MDLRLGMVILGASACSEQTFDGARPVTQEWRVTGAVDIVVFSDTSDSMTDQLVTLAANLPIFISRLEQVDADWHLIAVTGPDGCAQGGVLDRDTPDWQGLFAAGIQQKPTEDLVDEWGLYNAQQALAASVEGGCNDGFLRDEAYLHIVFISDEDDNSPGFDGDDPAYWLDYVDAFQASKSDSTLVRLSSVAGPPPIGCSSADYGRGYVEVAEATGGEFLSICSDWQLGLGALANNSIVSTTFRLSEVPDDGSVRAFVDGAERIAGWQYVRTTNSVVFEEPAPYAGQSVQVTYEVSAY